MNILKGIGDFFKGLINLIIPRQPKTPQIIIPEIKMPKPKPELPQIRRPTSPTEMQPRGIEQFSERLTPSLEAILGLQAPSLSPGLMIPGRRKP